MVWQIFGTKTSPTPMSSLDTQSQNLAQWSLIDATASGTNAITLTPNLSGFTAPAYLNYITYRFTAANSASGTVTLRISALAFLNVYGGDNTTQMTTGNIISGRAYYVSYNSALNSGAGGWTLTPLGTSTGGVSNPVLVAEGGTSQTTPATARGSSGLNTEGATSTSFEVNSSIAASARTVISSSTAMTGAHTLTLPAANAVAAGYEIEVRDLNGVVGSFALAIQRAGADTINGGTSVSISAQYGGYNFKSDGASKWTALAYTVVGGSALTGATSGLTTSGNNAIIDTNNTLGVGSMLIASASGSVASAATTAGSGLTPCDTTVVVTGAAPSGTWRNVSGVTSNVGVAVIWIRTV